MDKILEKKWKKSSPGEYSHPKTWVPFSSKKKNPYKRVPFYKNFKNQPISAMEKKKKLEMGPIAMHVASQSWVGKSTTFLIFPQILINFSYFSSKFSHFLPHFVPPDGQLAHPGRPWLRHCDFRKFWKSSQISRCLREKSLKGHWTTSASSPIFFFKKVEIFISLEVYTYVVTAC